MQKNRVLEIFSDYVWPWCYFSTVRVDELKEKYRIEVRWRAFPLHPETPEQGLSLEELFAGRDIDIPAAMARLRSVAEELGLPWGDRQRTYNSRLAQELGKWAEEKGKGDEFHRAIFHAYFAEGRNIARKEILLEIGCSIGLPGEEAREILVSRRFESAVDEDWRLSRAWGITAVPTFVMNQGRVVGAQSLEVLKQFLRDNYAGERGTRLEGKPS